MVGFGRVATTAGAVLAGFVVVVLLDGVDPGFGVGATVVVTTGTGAITGGVGKLAGQGSVCGSGLAVSSVGHPTPIDGEIHWNACQLKASPTRAPINQRPGQDLFQVTVYTTGVLGVS